MFFFAKARSEDANPRMLLAVMAVLWCTARFATADGAKQLNFVVFPIKTDLQRELLNSCADAYLQFDVQACARIASLIPNASTACRSNGPSLVSPDASTKKPRLLIAYRYTDGFLDADQQDALEKAIRGVCQEAGFVAGGSSMLGEGGILAGQGCCVQRPDGRRQRRRIVSRE